MNTESIIRLRRLKELESDSIWSMQCKGNQVLIRSGKPGKIKETEKQLEHAAAALSYAEKEEWARLRKGFILSEPAAPAGEPKMHRYLGRGQTGAMIVESLGEQVLFSQFDDASERDVLFLIGKDASLVKSISLPEKGNLAWAARYCHQRQCVLLRVDHQIYSYSIHNGSFEKLSDRNKRPVSFLSRSGNMAAWYAEPEIVVYDLSSNQVLLRLNVPSELYRGHSLQMKAELSPDGTKLACCSKAGELSIFDLNSGQMSSQFKGNFEMVEKLAFRPDGNRLFIQEKYGAWSLSCIDLLTMQIDPGWPNITEMSSGDFVVDWEKPRLAISRNQWIEIFDLDTMISQLKFRVDHVVKQSAITFVGRDLGVRTDNGCASLYALESAE